MNFRPTQRQQSRQRPCLDPYLLRDCDFQACEFAAEKPGSIVLEELIRAAADGKLDEQPQTILAMLQARLSCLSPQTRRVLCGASIFGQTFWHGGVLSLLGEEREGQAIKSCLDELEQREIIEQHRSSRFPKETEYRFRHALVRDAAYELLPPEDQALGHRLAGLFLEKLGEVGELDPIVLAEHARLGGDLPRAALHYLHAAEQSYERDDHDGLWARVARAIDCGASGEMLGRLHSLRLEVCLWREGWQVGLRIGKEALELLPRGSLPWSRMVGTLAFMTMNLGAMEEFATLVEALTVTKPEPDAVAAYCAAAGLTVALLAMLGSRERVYSLLGNLDQVALRIPDEALLAHGHMHQGRFTFAYFLGDDPWLAYVEATRAEAAFEKAQASRWRFGARMIRALAQAELGQFDEAEQTLRAYVEYALAQNDAWSLSYSRLYLMRLLAEREAEDQREETEALARQLIAHGGSEGVVAPAHEALARVLMLEGELEEAHKEAEKALEVAKNFRCWRPLIYRTLIEIHLKKGSPNTAVEIAQEGLRCIASLGGSSGHSDVRLHLAVSCALAAAGDMEAARDALDRTLELIAARAAKIPDPAMAARFLSAIPAHARARELDGSVS